MKSIADGVFELAQTICHGTPDFQKRRGPGKIAGNGMTDRFLRSLDEAVAKKWPSKVRRQEAVAPGVKYSFDYFIPSEDTAVEIALSLRNIVTEFEKDIFKAILANESNKCVRKLVLIGKDGSVKRQNGTGPRAIKAWAKQHCGVEIEIRDLL